MEKLSLVLQNFQIFFNTRYKNIVEKLSVTPANIKGNLEKPLKDSIIVKNLLKEYERHPSIIYIKNQNFAKRSYEIDFATTNKITEIIKEVDPKKATGPEKIVLKIIKLSANVIDFHLTYVTNSDIEKNSFSEVLKLHLSGLSLTGMNVKKRFSKIYKKYILEQFKPFLNDFLSQYMAEFRVHYSSNHLLIRLIEHWKKALDENFLVGTVLMDL